MEKLLIFHLDDTEYKKLEPIVRRLKIQYRQVAVSEYNQTLEALAAGRPNPLTPAFTGKLPPESLLLMCGFSDKRMDRLLSELRKAGIAIDFKAVLTPTNQKWIVPKLLLEMHKERAAYAKMQGL